MSRQLIDRFFCRNRDASLFRLLLALLFEFCFTDLLSKIDIQEMTWFNRLHINPAAISFKGEVFLVTQLCLINREVNYYSTRRGRGSVGLVWKRRAINF